jgi:histone deacetylase 6
VAVAAKHAIATHRAKRVLILDWDIHHGNGTQDLTFDDSKIMYISLHRFGGHFFPGTGKPAEVSNGTNCNIAFTSSRMGNVEYAAAFSELILPLIAEWSPDLYIISCGLDAAKGDLIGDCELTPDLYYCMTRSLLQIGGNDIPMMVALEGGYNLSVIGKCMEGVALALLDEPWGPTSEHRAWSEGENELDGLQKDCGRLTRARNTLSSYWNHNEARSNCINPSAARSLNKTMAALESSELWMDRITFRRFVPATPERTPRKMQTRADRKIDDDLSHLMDSLAL